MVESCWLRIMKACVYSCSPLLGSSTESFVPITVHMSTQPGNSNVVTTCTKTIFSQQMTWTQKILFNVPGGGSEPKHQTEEYLPWKELNTNIISVGPQKMNCELMHGCHWDNLHETHLALTAFGKTPTQNFINIWQTVQSLILGHRHVSGWMDVVSTQGDLLSYLIKNP